MPVINARDGAMALPLQTCVRAGRTGATRGRLGLHGRGRGGRNQGRGRAEGRASAIVFTRLHTISGAEGTDRKRIEGRAGRG